MKRDFKDAVKNVCHERRIQRSMIRAYSRNSKGDIDLSLVPQDLLDWHESSSEDEDDFDSDDIEWD